MAITTYGQLKSAIADWLDRGDMAARIPDLVRLAEATLNKVLRSRRMIGIASPAVTAGLRYATLPADLLEVVFATWAADEDFPLEQVSPESLVRLRRSRLRAAGTPRFFSVTGSRIELAPTPAGSGEIEVAYFQEIPALTADGDTNWVLDHDPDIYLYTSLLHGAHFLHDANRALVLENLLIKQITASIGAGQTLQIDPMTAGAGA